MDKQMEQNVPVRWGVVGPGATTPPFNFIFGSYSLNDWSVPYLVVSMSFTDAATYLRLPSELPGSEEIDWQVSELYQRDIDWNRVQTGLVENYLANRNHPHFFNSITIALLPFDDETNNRRPDFSSKFSWTSPVMPAQENHVSTLTIGPISLGFFAEDPEPGNPAFSVGTVRWNPEQVFGVAIDGQHRLAALKLISQQGVPAGQLKKSRVPVILLVFDERMGFKNPDGRSVVEMLRSLFIDLNKHAQTVSRARQILLDDRDAHAVCVRRLLATGLVPDLQSLDEQPPRLPLALVDWHSEQAKFDSGPYLTTVLGLDWLVTEVLTKSPRDFMSYTSLRKYMKTLSRILGVNLDTALKRLDEVESFGFAPFSFEAAELEAIAAAFGQTWSPGIAHIFTRLQPYADVIDVRHQDDSFSREFQHWYYLQSNVRGDHLNAPPAAELESFLSRVEKRPVGPIARQEFRERLLRINETKGKNLAFNVVFQKAMFLAYLTLAKLGADAFSQLVDDDFFDAPITLEEEDDAGPEEVVEVILASATNLQTARAKQFVDVLNRIFAALPEFLDIDCKFPDLQGEPRYLWGGTLRKAGGGIDFTQVAAARAHSLVLLLAGMVMYGDAIDPGSVSLGEFWAELGGSQNSLLRILRAGLNNWARESGGGGRRLSEEEVRYTDVAARDEAYGILKFVWEKLGL